MSRLNTAAGIVTRIVTDAGWKAGTSLENRAAHFLHRGGWTPTQVTQQHSVAPYRLDFAWVDLHLALEVDGWHHRSPEGAARDALRDSHLRYHGWIVLRVDDRHGEESFRDQLATVSELAHILGGTRVLGGRHVAA